MGTIYRKSYTKAVPPTAEITTKGGHPVARWRDRKGKQRQALLTTGADGVPRIRVKSGTYFAKYRDGDGLVVEVPTKCRNEDGARQVLAELERRAERQRVGLISPEESRVAERMGGPLAGQLADYLVSLEASDASAKHVAEGRRVLTRLFEACGFSSLAGLDRSKVEHYLNRRRQDKVSGRTRNIELTRLNAFSNWCVANGRLLTNPFASVARATEGTTRRRRAMTEDELSRLLAVARRRPLLEALTVRKGKRKGERYANVRPAVRRRLEQLGRERALIYKTLVLTGLRRNELEKMTVGQMVLDGPVPQVILDPRVEKNREGNTLPIRRDLAAELQSWLDDRLASTQEKAHEQGSPVPGHLDPAERLFRVPDKLVRILDRDLKAAGIAKKDERGRSLDVHAFRHTFGTWLSKGGVSLRTAQAAMRHADPGLTANVYTDPKLLDVEGALTALPALEIGDVPGAKQSTGEVGHPGRAALAPPLASKGNKNEVSPARTDKKSITKGGGPSVAKATLMPEDGRSCVALAGADKGGQEWAMQDLNLRPPACRAEGRASQTANYLALPSSRLDRCTERCTKTRPNLNVILSSHSWRHSLSSSANGSSRSLLATIRRVQERHGGHCSGPRPHSGDRG
jgi:integrase